MFSVILRKTDLRSRRFSVHRQFYRLKLIFFSALWFLYIIHFNSTMRFPTVPALGQESDFKAESIVALLQRIRRTFQSEKTKSYDFRKRQLQSLLRFLENHTEDICEAIWKDLHKPRQEVIVSEIDIVKNEILSALHCLKDWMAPHAVEKSLATMLDKPYIQHEPFGVALIIGAWNYPVNLMLSPLVGAMAAGNCAILKPSEITEHTERLLEELLPKYLDKDCFEVVCGGVEETGLLLKQQFDYIFFTGSTMVGRIVYEAAAKHLTPVTLELGGKSPVFVTDDADIAFTARRIMWGKTTNAGQTCIAPDYVLCSRETQDRLVAAMKTALHDVGLDESATSNDYCHIVSQRQFHRLCGLLKNQAIAIGGDIDAETNFISPTVLTDVDPSSPIMQEEIFGPLLPIVPVASVDEAIQFVKARDQPLALYVFSKNKNIIKKILSETTSGGVTVNDVIMHFTVDSLPFGGVGASGLGGYHGRHSFETFSHKRAVLWKTHGMDFVVASRYPPYSEAKTSTIQKLLKFRKPWCCC